MIRSVFIASVFDSQSPLHKILKEGGGISALVSKQADWKCIDIFKANIETIRGFFSTTDHSLIQVFHFAGHAFDKGLQLNDALGAMAQIARQAEAASYLIDPGGLATMIRAAHDVQLVFLNGCSTKNQVDQFIKSGVPAVIYTNRPLKDKIGFYFAKAFYQSFFDSGATLQQSFDIAIGEIKGVTINLPDGVIDKDLLKEMTRGGLNLNPPLDGPLYEIEATDEFRQKRLVDWPKPPEKISKSSSLSTGVTCIPAKTTLLCDRKEQKNKFEEALESIFSDSPPEEPYFFFIHDIDKSCPLSLSERFELFDRVGFLESSELQSDLLEWRQSELPETRHIKEKALCLERLKEIYDKITNSGGGPGGDISTSHKFITYHDLNDLDVLCDDRFKDLIRIYIEDFSPIMSKEFASCKIVLFSIEYYEPTSPFRTFFKEIADEYPDRIFNLTELTEVRKQHVGNWLRMVFKDKPDAPSVDDIFSSFDTDTPSVTMYEMQRELKKAIKNYNHNQEG